MLLEYGARRLAESAGARRGTDWTTLRSESEERMAGVLRSIAERALASDASAARGE
jgi:hypothetical protein